MTKIKVGGVPEHFNYPWHYGMDTGIFTNQGLKIEWQDVKGGSGAMCKMLENNELDVALVLTEGIAKHIHKGGKARIVQQYVKSPLIWGVHQSLLAHFEETDLSKARMARSRVGSGSHLMAYVHAEQNGYSLTDENFVTVGNIDRAIEAFEQDEADILLWEKFMTQPYVDQNKVTRIGQCISPWPCFMMVGSEKFLTENKGSIDPLSQTILNAAKQVTSNQNTVNEISKMYGLQVEEVIKWYSTVEWQTSPWVSSKVLQNVVSTLHRVGILQAKTLNPKDLCFDGVLLY